MDQTGTQVGAGPPLHIVQARPLQIRDARVAAHRDLISVSDPVPIGVELIGVSPVPVDFVAVLKTIAIGV